MWRKTTQLLLVVAQIYRDSPTLTLTMSQRPSAVTMTALGAAAGPKISFRFVWSPQNGSLYTEAVLWARFPFHLRRPLA